MKDRATRANTIIIVAGGKESYSYKGFLSEGYKVYPPYKKVSILLRVLREIWFRIPVIPKSIWFDKSVLKESPEYVVMRDGLITRAYIKWIKKIFGTAQINFLYENMVGRARHLYPDKIPDYVRVWTYDGYDSRKYGIRLKNTSNYFPAFVYPAKEKKYDLLFVGEDKGRGDAILKLKDFLEQEGLKMKVHIVAESRLDRKKAYYKARVPYEQISQWVAESKAILNVALENQEGLTVRDFESIFNAVKLVTTNEFIKKTPIYDEHNVFILNHDNWEELAVFLREPYVEKKDIQLADFSTEKMILEITGEDF